LSKKLKKKNKIKKKKKNESNDLFNIINKKLNIIVYLEGREDYNCYYQDDPNGNRYSRKSKKE